MRAHNHLALLAMAGWLCVLVVVSPVAAAPTLFVAATYDYDESAQNVQSAPTSVLARMHAGARALANIAQEPGDRRFAFADLLAAKAGDDVARRTAAALTREQDTALTAVMRDSNRLEHIFGQGGKHNLAQLTQELGGQQAVVREAILRVPRAQSEGVFKLSSRIGRQPVTITGRMMNGVPRISNIWVPR